ncbi:unnamed protein product [Adineta steineri]|uniref:Uncharacterized protein n=1 Tax=Adineta steineri TaxID=433720 RepID=A0A815NIM3_9BILA|nr:unnamed protein product [Adineta steineri]CAF1434362.1 unnamed protein product [Adineta steineri]
MFARLTCTKTNEVTVWFLRDQNVPTKIKINSDSDIESLKEVIFGATNKGQYQATYKAKTLKPSVKVPQDTTDDIPIVFTKIGNIPPLLDFSQSNYPTIRTATIPKNPITTNQISTLSQINQRNGQEQELNQLNHPEGICIDNDNSIYIADLGNHRIVKWNCNSNTPSEIIAGGYGQGNQTNQLSYPTDIIFDKGNNSFIISDLRNERVIRYFDQNQTNPQIIISNITCHGLTIDNNGFIYVSDWKKNEVRRWKHGDESGELVAGGNGKGDHLNQLNEPTYIFIDEDYSLYVSDNQNHRVMKWKKDATVGIIVVGGNGKGDSLKQLNNPYGVIVDHLGQIYVADWGNHRIIRRRQGKEEGEIVVGGNGQGNQLNGPTGLSFDNEESLYVVDSLNHRIRKYFRI